MINEIRIECKNSDSGKTVMRQWSWKNIKIIWLTVLVKFQRLFWAKTFKFLWLKFQAQFWSIISSINLGNCEKFTQKKFVVLFWFYSSILVPFTRIPLCVLPFFACQFYGILFQVLSNINSICSSPWFLNLSFVALKLAWPLFGGIYLKSVLVSNGAKFLFWWKLYH